MVALAVKALFALHHVFAAAGAFADHCPPGARQSGGGFGSHVPVGSDQLVEHCDDPGHEILRGQLPALHRPQPFLPLRCQLGGPQLIRHDPYQGQPFFRGNKLLFIPLHKAGTHQLFDGGGAGGGRSKARALHTL